MTNIHIPIVHLSKEDIKRINEICHEVEIEESESEENNLPLTAKNVEDSNSVNV